MKMLEEKRISNFDTMRAMACLTIVFLHTITTWRDDVTHNTFYCYPKAEALILAVLFPLLYAWAVPVFFMMSGALFTSKNLNVKKHIIKSVLIIVIFGTAYAWIENFFNSRTICISDCGRAILNMLQGKTWAFMWFMYAIAGCYILSPFIKTWINNTDKKSQHEMLLFLIILLSVVPTINDVTGMEITSFGISDYSGALLYFFSGAVLYRQYAEGSKEHSNRKILCILAGGVILALEQAVGYGQHRVCSGPNYIWTYLYSTSIFLIGLRNNKMKKLGSNKIILWVSTNSLCIYLVHMVPINAIYKGLHIFPDVFEPILGIAVMYVITLILTIITVTVMNKIPVIRKIVH